jgi:peptidoglycan/LPS O-acetylase OafA/YrhL
MTWHYALSFALFGGNWIYMFHPIQTMAAPLWSVSVEEQFYLFWPWVVRSGSRQHIARIAIGLLIIAFAAGVSLPLANIGEPFLSKNSVIRLDGIAGGALLAAILNGRLPKIAESRRVIMLIAAGAVWLIVAGTFDLFHAGARIVQTVTGYPMVALASTAILAAVLGAEGAVGAVLKRKEIVFLGRISYGLYVFHQVGLTIADSLFPAFLKNPTQWMAHFIVGLLSTGFCAVLSYFLLEQPFLRMKKRRFTIVQSETSEHFPTAVGVAV